MLSTITRYNFPTSLYQNRRQCPESSLHGAILPHPNNSALQSCDTRSHPVLIALQRVLPHPLTMNAEDITPNQVLGSRGTGRWACSFSDATYTL